MALTSVTYERILVALDGSELAEAVLPYVRPLAQRFSSAITLLRVIPPVTTVASPAAVGFVAPDPVLLDPLPILQAAHEEADGYLHTVAESFCAEGIKVTVEHPEGVPEQVIVERAQKLRAEAIAMTTHGRTGLAKVIFGSVAEDVLRHARCPVLLVRVTGKDK